MIKIQFLTMVGCHNCAAAKKIFDEIMPEFKDKVEVKEIDIASPEGQELVQKYSIMASPGIVIDGELFSTGGVSKEKLIEKLKSIT
jgi:glutaredoxin